MKAILVTRCDCRKELEIPYPPSPQIVVPLKEHLSDMAWPEERTYCKPILTRTFILKEFRNAGPLDSCAEYWEQLEAE